LPVDERNRSKGYGYVEFADRESLIAALTKRDTTFNNRAMKITVDEPKQDGGGYRNRTGDRGGDRMGNQQQDGPLKSDEADWRRPQPDASQGDSESNWSSGGRDQQQQQRYNQNRDNRYQNRQDNQRGGGYQRRGGGGGGGGGGDRGNWSGNRGGQEYNEGQRRQYSSIVLSFLSLKTKAFWSQKTRY
jgi:RNA recognition motif-containing protein